MTKMTKKSKRKIGGGKSLQAASAKRLSLYPLTLESALGAALQTGAPPEKSKKPVEKWRQIKRS